MWKRGDTIEGRTLYKGGHYLRKYGISCLRENQGLSNDKHLAIQYCRNFFINVISPDHRLLHSRLHIEVCLKKRRIGWFCFDAFLFLHSYVDDVLASTFGPRHRLGLRFWAGVLQHPQIWNLNFKIDILFSSSTTKLCESRIFCLFTFWVFFTDKSFTLISKHTHECQYHSLY